MNEVEFQIEQVEASMEAAREVIALRDSLLNLRDNDDFVKVIEEGYFKEEAARCVGLRADPNLRMQGDVQIQMVEDQITSIGGLRQYFIKIQQIAANAEQSLAQDQETHAALLAEAAELETV